MNILRRKIYGRLAYLFTFLPYLTGVAFLLHDQFSSNGLTWIALPLASFLPLSLIAMIFTLVYCFQVKSKALLVKIAWIAFVGFNIFLGLAGWGAIFVVLLE